MGGVHEAVLTGTIANLTNAVTLEFVRKTISQSFALVLGVGMGLWAAFPVAQTQAKSTFIDVSEIKEGMKGYGLTVFKGTRPERFDVEVIGVLHNFLPSQDLILVKTPHERLNVTKNVQGMSGSPIFLDGRIAGAYAYSWALFPTEPVAGVTPIKPMVHELHRPTAPGFFPLEQTSKSRAKKVAQSNLGTTGFEGNINSYDLQAHADQVRARVGPSISHGQATPVSTPLMVAGLTPRAFASMREMLEPMGLVPTQGGGGQAIATDDVPTHYENGGALGVQLATGDVSFMGLGTTTYAEGTRVTGFGHPMMGSGDVALPTTIGRVHWIYASISHSSKVGESARSLGALVQDRQSCVVVDETKTAPTIPVKLRITGVKEAPKTEWNMTIAEERYLAPMILSATVASAIEATVGDNRDLTWTLKSTVWVRGHGSTTTEDIGVSQGGMLAQRYYLMMRASPIRVVGTLLNNTWEEVHVDRVEMTLDVRRALDIAIVKAAEPVEPIVNPGSRARVRLKLQRVYGEEESRIVDVVVPEELAGRDVDIEVVPGWMSHPESGQPESVDDLLALFSKRVASPKTAVVQIVLPGGGVAARQHVTGRLPSFALDTLKPSNVDLPLSGVTTYVRNIVPTDVFFASSARVRVKVRSLIESGQ